VIDEKPEPKPGKQVKTLFVDAELIDCEGEGPMKCLRVREGGSEEWTLLYDGIEGFTHEPGTRYELKVEVSDVSDPPADASSKRLVLIEIVSQQPVPEKSP
jgi:hypothetical protein